MGIGFVLMAWTFIGIFCAICTTILLFCLSPTPSELTRSRLPWLNRWIVIFSPFVLIPYFLSTFFIYALWCSLYRGVDPGLGDGFTVPLVNGYALDAIDTPNKGFIQRKSGDHVYGITHIGMNDPIVYGKCKAKDARYSAGFPKGEGNECFFIFDTTSGGAEYHRGETGFRSALHARGLQDAGMQTMFAFYMEHRWALSDLVAVVIILIPVFSLIDGMKRFLVVVYFTE